MRSRKLVPAVRLKETSARFFYRYCHDCGFVSESALRVQLCQSCGRHFHAFYYFSEEAICVHSDRPRENSPEGYRPLLGIAACWTDDSAG